MTIINHVTKEVQTQPWRTENWMGDEWIEVPENLVDTAYANAGYCDLTIIDGGLVAITAKDKPTPQPTPDEQRDLLLAQLLENQLLMLNGMNDLVKI